MKVGAVLAGFALDIVGSSFFYALLYAIVGGDSVDDASRRMNASMELQVSAMFAGLAFTAMGGYVAAWLAKTEQLRHAAAVGALDLGFGLALLAAGPPETPLWLLGIALVLTVPAAAFGGWYRQGTEPKTR